MFGHPDDLKSKKFELQSCRSRRVLQLWCKTRLRRTSYEKAMKFFVQHITTGSSHEPTDSINVYFSQKPTVVTQYHCRFLAKTDSDSISVNFI